MIKAQISGRMVSSGISDVAFALVQSEKIRLKKLMMIMIIIQVTENHLLEKGDVGMVKRFSKKYGNKGRAFNYLQYESYVMMPVSA